MNQKEFGLYISQLREKAGYDSQAALAKESGVWNSTIARIESGQTKNPDPNTLAKLAPFLKTSYSDLMVAAGYLTHVEVSPVDTKSSTEITAAHRSDNPMSDLPEEAIKEIEAFEEFIKHKYKDYYKKHGKE